MDKDNERFWNSSVDDIKKGYSEDDDSYTCLVCNKKFTKGRIYKYSDELYDAKKSVKIHIENLNKFSFCTKHILSKLQMSFLRSSEFLYLLKFNKLTNPVEGSIFEVYVAGT